MAQRVSPILPGCWGRRAGIPTSVLSTQPLSSDDAFRLAVRVALISTVKDEEADLPAFLRSIEAQTRKPDIVVITSGKSSDKTDEILQEHEDTHYEDCFVWLPLEGGNRSFGRNEAIRFAMEEGIDIIACTNVSVLDASWLELIVNPIESGQADVVGGTFVIPTHTDGELALALLTQYTLQEIQQEGFVSALSMAFTVEAWRKVKGFSEEFDTSEDTEFVQRLHDSGARFSYSPLAMTKWKPPTLTLRGATKTYYQFAVTDGKAGLMNDQYGLTYLAYLIFPLTPLWLLFRIRKVVRAGLWSQIPYVLTSAIAIDFGRMIGYAVGKTKGWLEGFRRGRQ